MNRIRITRNVVVKPKITSHIITDMWLKPERNRLYILCKYKIIQYSTEGNSVFPAGLIYRNRKAYCILAEVPAIIHCPRGIPVLRRCLCGGLQTRTQAVESYRPQLFLSHGLIIRLWDFYPMKFKTTDSGPFYINSSNMSFGTHFIYSHWKQSQTDSLSAGKVSERNTGKPI